MAKKTNHKDLPQTLSVSKNILETACDFDSFELNVIILLLALLRPYLYVTTTIPDPGEFFLRFSSFSGRHAKREELVERINKLRQKDIRYKIAIPGLQLQVITGLFSSIVITAGGVLARLSAEAIPWLLYIGQGVGYVRVESDLFIEMSCLYFKRLYFLLCSRAQKGFYKKDITREQLYVALGIPKGTPIHDVQTRYLKGFQGYLNQKGSRYSFDFAPKTSPGPAAGRPTINSYELTFSVRPELADKSKQQGPDVAALNLLRKLVPILQRRNHNVMTAFEIHDLLIQNGVELLFYQAMSVYSQKTLEHQANTLPLILRDRFGIDVISKKNY